MFTAGDFRRRQLPLILVLSLMVVPGLGSRVAVEQLLQ
jgi:hypothetical protein